MPAPSPAPIVVVIGDVRSDGGVGQRQAAPSKVDATPIHVGKVVTDRSVSDNQCPITCDAGSSYRSRAGVAHDRGVDDDHLA